MAMAAISRQSGLRIELPEGIILAGEKPAPGDKRKAGRHGPRPLPGKETDTGAPLIKALELQDMQTVDIVDFDVTPEAKAAVRRAEPLERTVDFSMEVGTEESVVVLVEQDGVYSWHLPEESPKRRRASAAGDEVRFSITLGRPSAQAEEFRKRGFVKDFVVGRIRTYVLKFAVKWGTEKLMRFLERNVQPGLVDMSSQQPADWGRLNDLNSLDLPGDRPARILLFLHGTFSSTLGSYGALGGTEEGRELLLAAMDNYDAIIGFDHPTLSLSPEENARELLDYFNGYSWPVPPHLDIVTFSRGGLVYRAFAELLLPRQSWRPIIDRVIFVAVPNSGTHLAEPDNWHALLDMYTNLAAAASAFLSKIPQLTVATKIFNELIQGLGALGKYLATQAVTKGDVPGLAAMEPDGPFIMEINRFQTGQPTVDTTFYCAVTSEFEVRLFDDKPVPREFPKRLASTLADQLVDQLFGVANDLVVDTPSMTAMEQVKTDFIKERMEFGKNPRVYHTVYFAQPEVATALSRWLHLEGTKASGARSATGNWVPRGGNAGPVLPAKVKTNIIITTHNDEVENLRDDLRRSPRSEYVIVRRPYEGKTLNYAYHRNEVIEMIRGLKGSTNVLDGLNMHEYQASESRSTATAMEPWSMPGGGSTNARIVVLDDNVPVGVVPEEQPIILPAEESGSYTTPVDLWEEEETAAGPGDYSDEDTSPPDYPDARPHRSLRSRASRTAPTTATPPSPVIEDADASVQCHFYGEMESVLTVGLDATLFISVSREIVKVAAGMATDLAVMDIDPDRRIILDVRPRENLLVVGGARAEFDPPAPGQPAERYFSVRPTDEGEGEVWVTARQGQVPLVTLKFRVRIAVAQPEAAPPLTARATTDEPAKSSEPFCQMRIYERINGNMINYDYDLDIPGIVFKRYQSPPLQMDRTGYIQKVYANIEERWLSSDKDIEAFGEEMREMGSSLFSQLFPLELQQDLWENRDAIRRIQVVSTEPFIPWEIIHLTEPGQPLPDETLFLVQLGVVRWLHVDGNYYPQTVKIRRGRARYAIPDYPHPDDKLPGTAAEKTYLEDTFAAEPVAARSRPLRDLLRGPGSFDLLHFAGHGISEPDDIVNSQIQLEGRVENNMVIPEYLSCTAVEQQSRLKGEDGNGPMVVLNACQTGRMGFRLTGMGGFASAFLKRGAGIFISTLWSVSDQPARDFIIKLYDELRAGTGLAEAATAAREKAREAGDASWLCYVVYGHPAARIITDE